MNNDKFLSINVDMPESKILEILREAFQSGSTVLCDGIRDQIPGYLDPIIERMFYFSPNDQQYLIPFQGETLIFDPKFQLLLISKESNPKFAPNVFIKTTVINFSVTFEGLEDQLLGEVMRLERPQDEELKNENIEKISVFQRKMKEIESKIL